ncbi:MAG: pyridoxine 5'-phosphate synthase [Phycisphaera sp.]|nr:pyridoxine 5'-phosphate synthase [Phycisphaera sp.]
MPTLGLNIDHVATLRQARRETEPDPVWAAVEGQLAGASCITVHLREDRRHIQDHDVLRIKEVCRVKLNLEMAATPGMVKIAGKIKPHMATLVPEGRMEVTTEGGLDVAGQLAKCKRVVKSLRDAGVSVSAFIDADQRQVESAAKAGFEWCEIHTGPYARAFAGAVGNMDDAKLARELAKVTDAGRWIEACGMRFNAGHALNYLNVKPIAHLPGVRELHIGHSIISRSVFVGLREAVREMVWLIG